MTPLVYISDNEKSYVKITTVLSYVFCFKILNYLNSRLKPNTKFMSLPFNETHFNA